MLKIFPLVWMSLAFLGAQALEGATIQTTYAFTGSAGNIVIENGFLTADGVASGSLGNTTGVEFDTHNNINLTTLQNFGTFTMRFPDGSTASGNLHEDDTDVSLETFSGPFTQTLTFTGGAGIFVDVSGVLTGGGNIFPTYYTKSGEGTLTAPGLVPTPEPGSSFLWVVGSVLIFLSVGTRLVAGRADEILGRRTRVPARCTDWMNRTFGTATGVLPANRYVEGRVAKQSFSPYCSGVTGSPESEYIRRIDRE